MIAAGDMRRPRVLVVSLGRHGGVTQYGWSMAEALAARCDIAVVYSSAAENADRWPQLGVPHLAVDTFSSIPEMLLSLVSVRRFARIRAFARAFEPDVIYYPGGHAWKPVLDRILPGSAQTVLTVHDPDLHPGEDSVLHRLLDRVNRLRVHGYVLLNEAARQPFIARHGIDAKRVTVIPHGVFDDLTKIDGSLADSFDLAPLASLAGAYLLFIGRIRPYKGLEILLRAYRDASEMRDVPLVIAGSGELSAEERLLLDELEGRPVHLVNRWLDSGEVSALTAAARFVVLPYLSATQSGVIPLASASGVPAIASDSGGIAEQVVDGRTGILVPAGDPRALARALAEAHAMDEESYRAMSRACADHASDNWAWDALAGRLLEFLGSLPTR
jgi:glycosyltransferase involved in cell wall biosynthesis